MPISRKAFVREYTGNVTFLFFLRPQEGREQYELAATSEQGGKKSKPKGKKEKDKDMDELKKEVDLVSQFVSRWFYSAPPNACWQAHLYNRLIVFVHCCRMITNSRWMT